MANSLQHIKDYLRPQLEAMNSIIVDTLRSDSALTNEIVANYLKTKGKQLRPIMVLLVGQYCGGVNECVLQGGAAVEMLHNASLIHDDVIDQARERRGMATINSVWDNHVAVLVGDFFVTGALRCAVRTGDSRILDALAQMGRDLSLGEINQADIARHHIIDEATYMSIISAKTASLFECCAAVGGLAVNAPDDQLERLKHFARLLGICFQIKDDTFDYYNDPVVGKPTGNDLREGKVTLPLIHALNRTDLPECEAMRTLIQHDTLDAGQIEQLVDYAKRAGGIDYAYETMQRLKAQADGLLDPDNSATTMLSEIFDYIIDRNK